MKWLLNTPKTEPKPGTLIVFISKKGKLSAGYISQEVLYYDYYDGSCACDARRLVYANATLDGMGV